MKKLISLSAAILSLFLITSCGPTLTVTNDYDHTANFSQYHTFRIVKLEQQYQALSQLNQNRVIAAVRQQMIAKGFTETENADLLVKHHEYIKESERNCCKFLRLRWWIQTLRMGRRKYVHDSECPELYRRISDHRSCYCAGKQITLGRNR